MVMLNGGAAVKNCMTIPQKKEKVNIELPSDLETPFLGIYSKARKAKTWTDGCIFMFMALLVTNNTVHTIDTSRDG